MQPDPPSNILKRLTISGFRGFATPQAIEIAIPHNGVRGSGYTAIVGPNNSGKSTIFEALLSVARGPNNRPSLSEGRRNAVANDRVEITLTSDQGKDIRLSTAETLGSDTQWSITSQAPFAYRILVRFPRRHFPPYLDKGGGWNRNQLIKSQNLPAERHVPVEFAGRLRQIQRNRDRFDAVFARIVDRPPQWEIDTDGRGEHYVKVRWRSTSHSSEGLGDGLISLFFIVDALYDSEEADIIAIDEPELSLHPHFQRKLADLLLEYARTRQIICATHSPYFVDWHAIVDGAQLVRMSREGDSCVARSISDETRSRIGSFLGDQNNPHVLGLDATEAFFLPDAVILVEGQEDVISYRKIMDEMGETVSGEFFGWGVGGAEKMRIVASLLKDLGFRRVVGILDGNKSDVRDQLARDFPEYLFLQIPTDDVRSKPKQAERPAREGILSRDGTVNADYHDAMRGLFSKIRAALIPDDRRAESA